MEIPAIEKKTIRVTIELTSEMLGPAPKNKELYAKFIAGKFKELHPEIDVDAEVADIKEVEEAGWTGFREDKDGLYVPGYSFCGFFKEAGEILLDQHKVKQIRSKVSNFVSVEPRKVRLMVDGKNKTAPDGVLERPLRAMTMQGPRVTLARSDQVDGCQMTFEATVIKNKHFDADLLRFLLQLGAIRGMGQWRNAGYGQFKVVSIEEL